MKKPPDKVAILEGRVQEMQQQLARLKALIDEARYALGEPRKGKLPSMYLDYLLRARTLLKEASSVCGAVYVPIDSKKVGEEILGKGSLEEGDEYDRSPVQP